MCQHDSYHKSDKVEHYFNIIEAPPVVLDPLNPTVGLTNTSIIANNGFLTCKFTREKKVAKVINYFDLTNNFYVLGANGAIENGNVIF